MGEVVQPYGSSVNLPLRPNLAVEYRRGVTDSFDVGGTLFTYGAGVDARHVLTRADAVETSLGLGLHGTLAEYAPLTNASPSGDHGYAVGLDPSFRLGVNVSRKSQLGVGLTPSVLYGGQAIYGRSGRIVTRGISFSPELTVAFDLGISDGFHIVPQVGVATFVGSDSYFINDDTVRLRGSLGLYF